MEDSSGFQGVDSAYNHHMEDSSGSQGVDSAYNHDLEKHSDLNNSALDIATRDEKALQDPNIVDWDGPDDRENPLNWSSSKKLVAMTLVSLVTMLS